MSDDVRIAEAVRNYECFMGDPAIGDFRRRGGRVFVATEGRSIGQIAALHAAGHRDFAEKFIQEAETKLPSLRECCPGIRFHFFGQLQRNKVKRATAWFDCIESIDRPPLAHRIRRQVDKDGPTRLRSVFVQVNTGREPQKGGVAPDDAQSLIDLCNELDLPLAGLMAIPPKGRDPVPHFQFLRTLADANGLSECQMGMSDDWRIAVRKGATGIRIGRAVFSSLVSAP